ncbi:hypothetical protein AQUCO_05400052v1 [Aquilegia coerulea]|uniref:Polyphenol oxidase C-terminal domain-containing protein n=1 Tax=Aquilegia coerulea TaxID=218851 RepID=A0A2G5CHD6_AQUCA|nr:hypothetical protein AQUCO_05400052v1 [Aquilegia coerulea]
MEIDAHSALVDQPTSLFSYRLAVIHVDPIKNWSKMSLCTQLKVPFLNRRNINNLTNPSLSTQTFLQTSCVLKPFCKLNINRRNAVIGLTLLTTFTTTTTTNNQSLMAASVVSENGSSDQVLLTEFGSDPRQLNCTIRVIVPRPKSGFSEDETVEVLKVIDVDVPNNGSARFDVYVAKADGKDIVGSDLGEFAGTLIEEERLRFGKRALSLGVTNLVKRIGGENCEKLIVSLVPRDGELSIGGVRIDQIQAQ